MGFACRSRITTINHSITCPSADIFLLHSVCLPTALYSLRASVDANTLKASRFAGAKRNQIWLCDLWCAVAFNRHRHLIDSTRYCIYSLEIDAPVYQNNNPFRKVCSKLQQLGSRQWNTAIIFVKISNNMLGAAFEMLKVRKKEAEYSAWVRQIDNQTKPTKHINWLRRTRGAGCVVDQEH